MTQKITVKLTPGAKKNEIGDWEEDLFGDKTLKVYVTTIPENGKANKSMIDLLSKTWKIPKTSISIIRGATSRVKILEIPKETTF